MNKNEKNKIKNKNRNIFKTKNVKMKIFLEKKFLNYSIVLYIIQFRHFFSFVESYMKTEEEKTLKFKK